MITQFLRVARIAAILWIGITAAHAQGQKSFVRDDLASESVRLQQSLKSESAAYAGAKSAAQLRREGQSSMASVYSSSRNSRVRSAFHFARVNCRSLKSLTEPASVF